MDKAIDEASDKAKDVTQKGADKVKDVTQKVADKVKEAVDGK